MHWWEKCKFYQSTSGVTSACGNNKPVLVGGIGEINFGKQFRQGNRVYDSNGIACSLTTNGGGIGSYTGLYIVEK